jgi:hypothetical protein
VRNTAVGKRVVGTVALCEGERPAMVWDKEMLLFIF